jgi:2-keto-4-pentenoate hydratase/2-oxohepta-3-ene-1,7-dioic acid hydratase in catechol pathway
MTMRVNGVVTQHDRTSSMNWPIDKLIYECDYRSRMTTADLLYTGTCGFIGVPDGFCEPGDVIEAEIEGIGVLRNVVEASDPYRVVAGEQEDEEALRERLAGGMSHRGVVSGA